MKVEDEIKQKLMTLEQIGFKDNDFKIELVRALVLVDILEKISDEYIGVAPLVDELQNITIEYPPHEYFIPLVGKINFIGLLYGEISYQKKINYPIFHVILVKTYRFLEGRATKETEDFVKDIKRRIYSAWRKIDEKFFYERMIAPLKEIELKLRETLSKSKYSNLPFPLNLLEVDLIRTKIKYATSYIDLILEIYQNALNVLKEVRDLKIEVPTESDSVALARYPATDFEDKYSKLIPIILKNKKKEMVLMLDKLWDYIQKMPNPNILAEIINALEDKSVKEKAKKLLEEYSKVFLNATDTIYLLREEVKASIK
ncbi:MAG: hypothetical protein ACP6IS_03545 [Candidatus Asgardarchaeia archaeon]